MTIYSDDVTYPKTRDVSVLYDVAEGLTSDKLTFSTYSLFHEMREDRSGEFEFYIREVTDDSRIFMESLSDDFTSLTSFTIEALDADGDEEVALSAYLDELEALRDLMGKVEDMQESRVNSAYTEALDLDIPLRIDVRRRVLTFLSEAGDSGSYDEEEYVFRPLVGSAEPSLLLSHALGDEDPAIVVNGESHHLGEVLEIRSIERSKFQDFCSKQLATAQVVFPGFSGGGESVEFTMSNKLGAGVGVEEIERVLRTGIRLEDGHIRYGGASSGLEGGLESLSFDLDFNMQIQWRQWRNCGSVIIMNLPNSFVSIVRAVGVKQIDGDYVSFQELETPEAGVWSPHINQASEVLLDASREEILQRYPVPHALRFFNQEDGFKYAFYMMTGAGSRFFVEIDRELSLISFTSLCYDFTMGFTYRLSESSCYSEYKDPEDREDSEP